MAERSLKTQESVLAQQNLNMPTRLSLLTRYQTLQLKPNFRRFLTL